MSTSFFNEFLAGFIRTHAIKARDGSFVLSHTLHTPSGSNSGLQVGTVLIHRI